MSPRILAVSNVSGSHIAGRRYTLTCFTPYHLLLALAVLQAERASPKQAHLAIANEANIPQETIERLASRFASALVLAGSSTLPWPFRFTVQFIGTRLVRQGARNDARAADGLTAVVFNPTRAESIAACTEASELVYVEDGSEAYSALRTGRKVSRVAELVSLLLGLPRPKATGSYADSLEFSRGYALSPQGLQREGNYPIRALNGDELARAAADFPVPLDSRTMQQCEAIVVLPYLGPRAQVALHMRAVQSELQVRGCTLGAPTTLVKPHPRDAATAASLESVGTLSLVPRWVPVEALVAKAGGCHVFSPASSTTSYSLVAFGLPPERLVPWKIKTD